MWRALIARESREHRVVLALVGVGAVLLLCFGALLPGLPGPVVMALALTVAVGSAAWTAAFVADTRDGTWGFVERLPIREWRAAALPACADARHRVPRRRPQADDRDR